VVSDVQKIKRPKAFLGDLAVDEVPVYLQALARAGRMIVGMAIYMEPDVDLRNAVRILEMVEKELEEARKQVGDAHPPARARAGMAHELAQAGRPMAPGAWEEMVHELAHELAQGGAADGTAAGVGGRGRC